MDTDFMNKRLLLIDVGNTNTDFGLATARRILRTVTVPTPKLSRARLPVRTEELAGVVLASVVPATTRKLLRWWFPHRWKKVRRAKAQLAQTSGG